MKKKKILRKLISYLVQTDSNYNRIIESVIVELRKPKEDFSKWKNPIFRDTFQFIINRQIELDNDLYSLLEQTVPDDKVKNKKGDIILNNFLTKLIADESLSLAYVKMIALIIEPCIFVEEEREQRILETLERFLNDKAKFIADLKIYEGRLNNNAKL